MTVLHINSYYSASNFYKNLFDNQEALGLDISVYVPVPRGSKVSISQLGSYSTVSPNHGKYDRILFHLKHYKIFNDIKKRYNIKSFNVLHAHSLFSNGYIAFKLHLEFGIPYIVAVRNTDINIFFRFMPHLRNLGIKILQNAEKVVFISPAYRDNALKPYLPAKVFKAITDKSVVIPNGIDPFWLNNKPIRAHHITPGEDIKIIFAGRISKRKNASTTAEACNILKNRGYKVKFTVVGRVEDNREFLKLKKYDFVSYCGHQPKEKLLELYRSNNIFVMPSKTETFGLVYAEAMSQGLPVIYSKGQGFDGQFEEGQVGYHVDFNNSKEIADRIIDIVNNYDTLSRNCTKLCVKFDWNKINKEYTNLYLCCLKKTREYLCTY